MGVRHRTVDARGYVARVGHGTATGLRAALNRWFAR